MSTKETVIAALAAIEDAAGRLTPEAIVVAAKPKNHVLHDRFEWNDGKAGHAYRLIQAQKLMTLRVKVVENSTTYSIPLYVHDPETPDDEQGYVNTLRVRTEPENARAVLVDEMARVAGHLRRARELAFALGMSEQIEEIEGQVSQFLGNLKREQELAAAA